MCYALNSHYRSWIISLVDSVLSGFSGDGEMGDARCHVRGGALRGVLEFQRWSIVIVDKSRYCSYCL